MPVMSVIESSTIDNVKPLLKTVVQAGKEPGIQVSMDAQKPAKRIHHSTRIRVLWWILFAGFCVSMLTWIPGSFPAWTTVFNNGLTLSIVLLSITLITGMAGQLSLCQASLAGIGAFTAAQLANHLGLNLFVGGLVG